MAHLASLLERTPVESLDSSVGAAQAHGWPLGPQSCMHKGSECRPATCLPRALEPEVSLRGAPTARLVQPGPSAQEQCDFAGCPPPCPSTHMAPGLVLSQLPCLPGARRQPRPRKLSQGGLRLAPACAHLAEPDPIPPSQQARGVGRWGPLLPVSPKLLLTWNAEARALSSGLEEEGQEGVPSRGPS